jgi:hypothetical protein
VIELLVPSDSHAFNTAAVEGCYGVAIGRTAVEKGGDIHHGINTAAEVEAVMGKDYRPSLHICTATTPTTDLISNQKQKSLRNTEGKEREIGRAQGTHGGSPLFVSRSSALFFLETAFGNGV